MKTITSQAKIRITRNTVAALQTVQAGAVVTVEAVEALALLDMRAAELVDPPDRQSLIAAARAAVAQRRLPAQWSPR